MKLIRWDVFRFWIYLEFFKWLNVDWERIYRWVLGFCFVLFFSREIGKYGVFIVWMEKIVSGVNLGNRSKFRIVGWVMLVLRLEVWVWIIEEIKIFVRDKIRRFKVMNYLRIKIYNRKLKRREGISKRMVSVVCKEVW